MSVERRQAQVRHATLGPGAVQRLRSLTGSHTRALLLLTPSLSDADEIRLRASITAEIVAVVRPRGATADVVAATRAAVDAAEPGIVVAAGGGTVLDIAKAATRPGPPALALVPTTLSGSEHTANTSWWDGPEKIVRRVGAADAVLADPDLLVQRHDVLTAGAFHAIAHALATLAVEPAPASAPGIARRALADLVAALSSASSSRSASLFCDDAIRYVRGGWNAAVGLALTGPRIGAHHALVHRLAGPGEHAAVSAGLLCATLTRTNVHRRALASLPPQLASDLLELAAAAASERRLRSEGWTDELIDAVAPPHRDDAAVILRAAAA